MMADLDMSTTVRNILSSLGRTAQKTDETVIRTAAGLANLPALDTANLANLPGLRSVFGTPPDRGKALGPGASERQATEQVQRKMFSPFNEWAMRGAMAMYNELVEIAQSNPGDAGLADAIGVIVYFGDLLGEDSGLVGDLPPNLENKVSDAIGDVSVELGKDHAKEVLALIGLRQYVLTLFITHYPPAHKKFKIEPLDVREPNLVSRAGSRVLADPKDPETAKENQLNYWREDAQLNEHHGQWHSVYPTGINTTTGQGVGHRNGELFAYMHEQMLARYDAERLCVGLPRVKPFDKYPRDYRSKISEEIPEGYDPGPKVMKSSDGRQNWTTYGARPAMATISDLPADETRPARTLEDLATFREALRDAAHVGYYRDMNGAPIRDDTDDKKPIAATNDNFGDTIEASAKSIDLSSGRTSYGDLHGMGHVHIARFDEPFDVEKNQPNGVMLDLYVAVRDPMFWRWHKHIDTIVQIRRETVGRRDPYNFADGPPVTVRGKDIIVCDRLPAGFDDHEKRRALGAKAFGYSKVATENRWDTDFSSRSTTITLSKGTKDEKTVTVLTTGELETKMLERTIRPVNPDTKEQEDEKIVYLSHEDFFYFIRLQNHAEQERAVTVRIFLAPEIRVEDNTSWIEMDRFRYVLKGSERAVVFRRARESAVIRKPAIGHAELGGTEPRDLTDAWCDCGWPYNLLLPRGTKEGLEFRLLVMLSNGDDLKADSGHTDTSRACTSISYCGLQNTPYPDEQLMGYPFDRTLPDSIDSIIGKHDNWASRKINIRCLNPEFNPLR